MLIVAYAALLAGLALNAPASLWDVDHRPYFVVVGVIGLWRYGWNILHFLRSVWYRRVTFRRRRRALDRLLAADEGTALALRVPELFIVVTSFRIRAETAAAV